ncbi:hypothetical protein, partial [Streptomyces sp. NPDC127190]|uniref:hypothetical protein n=1 Tax=Streptomyces sp. NPDC127190 TaxID=3345387 RepID=UPI0036437F05
MVELLGDDRPALVLGGVRQRGLHVHRDPSALRTTVFLPVLAAGSHVDPAQLGAHAITAPAVSPSSGRAASSGSR